MSHSPFGIKHQKGSVEQLDNSEYPTPRKGHQKWGAHVMGQWKGQDET
jgi:hypothetical protein